MKTGAASFYAETVRMTLLESIKTAVRIRDSMPKTEAEKQREADIRGYIEACKDDLRRIGIREDRILESDARIVQACKLFVMASIDYHGKGADYWSRYQAYVSGAALDVLYVDEEAGQDV